MIRASLLFLGFLFLSCWLQACSQPRTPLTHEANPADTAGGLQRRLWASLDSLNEVMKRPVCQRIWRADLGDSIWQCSDPKPPGAP